MNIILTGAPGIGKTTVVEQVARALGDRAGGIITREIREEGKRTGFSIESLQGQRQVLASKYHRWGPRVGPYRVSVANLEKVGIDSLRSALLEKAVVIIDEIGKMELMSERFRVMIIRVLDNPIPVVATLGVSRDPFLDSVRERPDVRLLDVTIGNRKYLAEEILQMIGEGS